MRARARAYANTPIESPSRKMRESLAVARFVGVTIFIFVSPRYSVDRFSSPVGFLPSRFFVFYFVKRPLGEQFLVNCYARRELRALINSSIIWQRFRNSWEMPEISERTRSLRLEYSRVCKFPKDSFGALILFFFLFIPQTGFSSAREFSGTFLIGVHAAIR